MCEEMIIKYCSPTLMGIKTGNMFSFAYTSAVTLREDIREMNRRLKDKGLRVLPLKITQKNALIYVYRPKKLQTDLDNDIARKLLSNKGYTFFRGENCVVKLIERIRKSDSFPHEIGLFLGYPPEDVKGFIEQGARGCKFTGVWKVYSDENKAKALFEQYKKCTEDNIFKMLQYNSKIEELTVAV